MKLQTFTTYIALAICTLVPRHGVVGDVTKHAFDCETDADCANFDNTICMTVDNDGTTIGKCTPNTAARPACRGGQPGICPSYQAAEQGYLNLQCIFVANDDDGGTTTDGSGSTTGLGTVTAPSRRRYLLQEIDMATTTNVTTAPTHPSTTTAAVHGGSSSGQTDATILPPVNGGSSSGSTDDDKAGPALKPAVTVKIGGMKITGKFECHPVSSCPTLSADPTNCLPKECGSPNSMDQCNNHGTCSYGSPQNMKHRCICNRGYGGDKCQTEISGKCDVDCGVGGDCVDGMCKCKKGFDGAGKNRRCTKCTSDKACQNNNPCNLETGTCVCKPGFSGMSCGATEDGCTTKVCTGGTCQLLANQTGACFCPICAGNQCDLCPKGDCSTCPSPAATIVLSKVSLVVASIVAMWIGTAAW